MTTKPAVTEGTMKHGLPQLALGSGNPLIVLRGFTTTHAHPPGCSAGLRSGSWLRWDSDSESTRSTALKA